MKNIILFISILVLTSSCNQTGEKTSTNLNENYSKNLATAQKFFDLFLTEDIEGQKPLICPGVTHYPPFYGCLLYTSPSPRDATLSRMPSSA